MSVGSPSAHGNSYGNGHILFEVHLWIKNFPCSTNVELAPRLRVAWFKLNPLEQSTLRGESISPEKTHVVQGFDPQKPSTFLSLGAHIHKWCWFLRKSDLTASHGFLLQDSMASLAWCNRSPVFHTIVLREKPILRTRSARTCTSAHPSPLIFKKSII